MGREAYLAFLPSPRKINDDEPINLDFGEVVTFSPSWGDEFLRPLVEKYGDHLVLVKTDNPSVIATVEILEKSHKLKFKWA